MARVSINDLTPGMILEEDVLDLHGRLLLGSGQELSEKHIRIFKIWGVPEAAVKSPGGSAELQKDLSYVPEDIRKKAEEIVAYRFRLNSLDHPFAAQLYQLASAKKAKQMSTSSEGSKREFISFYGQDSSEGPVGEDKGVAPDTLIEDRLKLGTIANVYHKMIEAVNDPDASLRDIAGIMGKDPALSARVLQMVNSSFYGLVQKVETLTRALALIGTNQLMTIFTGVSVVNLFKDIPSKMFNMASFWEHSIASGIVARLLSSYLQGTLNSERFFVAGLLHDVGRLVIAQSLPQGLRKALTRAREEEILLHAAEKEVMGYDHSEVGGLLAKKWNMPLSLENMIASHHEPSRNHQPRADAVINIADIIVNALEIGNSGEYFVPVIEPETWDRLGLDISYIEPIAVQLEHQLEDVFELVYGGSIGRN